MAIGEEQKVVGLHLSQKDHNEIKDIEFLVLDFINKSSKEPEAIKARYRVEKSWINSLRSPVPSGLNIFN